MFKSLVLVLAASLGTAVPTAGAAVVYVDQERTLYAQSQLNNVDGTFEQEYEDAAIGFENFDSEIGASTGGAGGESAATAGQDSTLAPDAINVAGNLEVFAETFKAWGTATGETYFHATFEITQPSTFAITGSFNLSGYGFGGVDFEHAGGGHVIGVAIQTQAANTIDVSGALAPGVYTLMVEAHAQVSSSTVVGSGNFDVTLAITSKCPADTDNSGDVDVTDLVAVILDWGSTNSAADVNADGVVNVSDLNDVFVAWGACGP